MYDLHNNNNNNSSSTYRRRRAVMFIRHSVEWCVYRTMKRRLMIRLTISILAYQRATADEQMSCDGIVRAMHSIAR